MGVASAQDEERTRPRDGGENDEPITKMARLLAIACEEEEDYSNDICLHDEEHYFEVTGMPLPQELVEKAMTEKLSECDKHEL